MPQHGAKSDKEHRTASIFDFASRLYKALESNILDSAVATELSQQLARPFPVPSLSKAKELDERGRALWNASIQSQHRNHNILGFSSELRAFAFYLLDIANQGITKNNQGNSENVVRVLRVALKAGKACIDDQKLDLATQVLARAAAHVESRNKEHGPKRNAEDDAEQIFQQLTAEYFLLRAVHSWKYDRFETIGYWLAQMVIHNEHGNGVVLIEKKADFLYEVGKAELRKRTFKVAAEWLEKSFDTIDMVDQADLSPDGGELRQAIMNDLVQSWIGINDADSLSKASGLITRMEIETPEFKMSISLLRLNCLLTHQLVDVEQTFNGIIRIVNSVHLIDNNIKTILHHIHRLKKANEIEGKPDTHSVKYACQALEVLLPRLYGGDNQSWIEKVVVTRVWLGVSVQPTLAAAKRLNALFDETYSTTGIPFGPEATHAAQSLIWKHIDIPLMPQQEGGSETWCRLACHALFQKAGDLNKSRLGRKMMLNALATGDTATAREAYFAMPESGKVAPVTKYIMYKVALRSGDAELASSSLDGVLKASSADPSFLYACTLEAQQNGNRQQAIAALQKVLEYCDHNTLKGVYLPALLRATAKMIILEISKDAVQKSLGLVEVCRIFEGAMSQAKTFRTLESGETNAHCQAELRWFANNSYNLTLIHMTDMDPELLIRFIMVCICFLDMLRIEAVNDVELVYRLLLCRFLAASALVMMGRTEDNVELALSHYLDARRQIEAYRKCHVEAVESGKLQDDTRDDLIVKDFELLKYDLEALMKLQHWSDLDRVLGLCLAQQHSTRWGSIADLIIHIHTHILNESLADHYQRKIPLVIEKIVNTSWNHEKDVRKFARWMRCLYQMTLNMNPPMALECVQTARNIAIGARAARSLKTYPKDELAWLTTSAFNHAVEIFCAGDRENGRLWADKALNLAMAGGKDTGLHEALQAKWLVLQARAGISE